MAALLLSVASVCASFHITHSEIILGPGELVDCYQSKYFSDGSNNHEICNDDRVFKRLECEGRYCDNVRLECCKIKTYGGFAARQDCFWSDYTSDEHGKTNHDKGLFVSGLQCAGRYCDNKRSYLCRYDGARMETEISSEFSVSDEGNWNGCDDQSSLRRYHFSGRYGDNFHGGCSKIVDVSKCPIGKAGEGCEVCGNGVVQGLEECDDPNNDGCTEDCEWGVCGDGLVQKGKVRGVPYMEECDDGPGRNREEMSCTHQCKKARCGDGFLHELEQCEDVGSTEENLSCDNCLLNLLNVGYKFHTKEIAGEFQQLVEINWDLIAAKTQQVAGFWVRLSEEGGKVVVHPQRAPADGSSYILRNAPMGTNVIASVQIIFDGERVVNEDRDWFETEKFQVPCTAPGSKDHHPSELVADVNPLTAEICLQWMDNSLCDASYAILKQSKRDEQRIIINNEETNAGSWGRVTSSHCDNIRTADYKVGSSVEYCIDQDFVDSDIQLVREIPCVTSIIPWVAFIDVDISLSGSVGLRTPLEEFSFKVYVNGVFLKSVAVFSSQGTWFGPVVLSGTITNAKSKEFEMTLSNTNPETLVMRKVDGDFNRPQIKYDSASGKITIDGECLNAVNANVDSQPTTIACNGSPGQQWTQDMHGKIRLRGNTNMCLENEGGVMEDFNKIVFRPCAQNDEEPDQIWSPIPLVDTPTSNTVTISPTSFSDDLEHEILCMYRGAERNCMDVSETIDHLSEAQFLGIDKTVRPIRGKLSYSGTGDYTRNEKDCGVRNETVCAVRPFHSFEHCAETDPEGRYTLTLPLGIEFEIFVKSDANHEYVNKDGDEKYRFTIRDEESAIDFYNLETYEMTVNYFGGECAVRLEGAKFTITSDICDGYSRDIVISGEESSFTDSFAPMKYTVTYLINKDPNADREFQADINDYFKSVNGNRQVDLSNSSAVTDFRYQSDIEIKMLSPEPEQNCSSLPPILGSFSVLRPRFGMMQKYPHGANCSSFSNKTQLVLLDQLGEQARRLAMNVYEGEMVGCSGEEKEATHNCTDPLNMYEVDYRRGTIAFLVITGSPNFQPPHEKHLYIESTADGRGSITKQFDVIVIGQNVDADDPDKVVFSLPKWMPLLILRDPPGDASFSEFSKLSKITTGLNMGFNIGGSYTSFERRQTNVGATLQSCVTDPLTNTIQLCQIAKKKVNVKRGISDNKMQLTIDQSLSQDITFITETAYQTSSLPYAVGRNGDMFVVPTMSIVIGATDVLKVIDCVPERTRELVWEFEGDISADSVAIMTRYSIETLEMPRILTAIEDNLKDSDLFDPLLNETLHEAYQGWTDTLRLSEDLEEKAMHNPRSIGFKTHTDPLCESNQQPRDNRLEEILNNNLAKEEGNILEETKNIAEDKVKAKVLDKILGENGSLLDDKGDVQRLNALCQAQNPYVVIEEYQALRCRGLTPEKEQACLSKDEEEITSEMCKRNYISDDCSKAKLLKDHTSYDGSLQEASLKAIKNINKLQFSGGGTEYSLYTTGKITTKQSFEKKMSAKLGVLYTSTTNDKKAGVDVKIDKRIGGGLVFQIGAENKDEEEREASVGFTLKDETFDDQFTVEVFTDPLYGTPVFKTVAGRSKCPWEPGTTKIEDTEIMIARGASNLIENVPKHKSAFIELELVNHNPYEIVYMTFDIVPESNPHGLRVFYDGQPLSQINLALDYNTKFKVTLEAKRAEEYIYDNIVFELGSTCESALSNVGLDRELINSQVNASVHFIEPCAEIDFTSDLRQTDFLINSVGKYGDETKNLLAVTIQRNKDSSSFAEQKRLNVVEFQYRKVGSQIWNTPLTKEYGKTPTQHFFFNREKDINVETTLGTSTLYWDTESLLGGEYELRARASCNKDTGIEDLDSTVVSAISGTIDRLPPAIFTRPMPADGMYTFGDRIGVRFDEDIDCSKPYRYSGELYIPSLSKKFEYDSGRYESKVNKLTTYCRDNLVEFSLTAYMDYSLIMGAEARMKVCNIADVKGNKMKDCANWWFTFEDVSLVDTSTASQFSLFNANEDDNEKSIQKRGILDYVFTSHFNHYVEKKKEMNAMLLKAMSLTPPPLGEYSDLPSKLKTGTRRLKQRSSEANEKSGVQDIFDLESLSNGRCIVYDELAEQVGKEIAVVAGIDASRVQIDCIRQIQPNDQHKSGGVEIEYSIDPSYNDDLVGAKVTSASAISKLANAIAEKRLPSDSLLLEKIDPLEDSMPLRLHAFKLTKEVVVPRKDGIVVEELVDVEKKMDNANIKHDIKVSSHGDGENKKKEAAKVTKSDQEEKKEEKKEELVIKSTISKSKPSTTTSTVAITAAPSASMNDEEEKVDDDGFVNPEDVIYSVFGEKSLQDKFGPGDGDIDKELNNNNNNTSTDGNNADNNHDNNNNNNDKTNTDDQNNQVNKWHIYQMIYVVSGIVGFTLLVGLVCIIMLCCSRPQKKTEEQEPLHKNDSSEFGFLEYDYSPNFVRSELSQRTIEDETTTCLMINDEETACMIEEL